MTLTPESCQRIEDDLQAIWQLINDTQLWQLSGVESLDKTLASVGHLCHNIRSEIAYNRHVPKPQTEPKPSAPHTVSIDDLD